MEGISLIIYLLCGLYIFKHLYVIYSDFITPFVWDIRISRSDEGNAIISMFLTLFLVLMSLAIFLAVIHTLFGDFDFIFVILASLYFKFGTDKGRISDN